MNDLERLQAERDCIKLSSAFSYYLDHRRYEDLANLFAPDGVWVRHGHPLRGRKEIVAAMEKRPPNQFTRHVTTGHHFLQMDGTTARSFAYNMSYFTLETSEFPARYNPEQAMLLDFLDSYKKTPEGWRFAERVTKEVLIPDAVRAMLAAHH